MWSAWLIRLLLSALGGLAPAIPARSGGEVPAAPLPELTAFLGEVRERIHSDEYLLDQYTFTERHTERRLDGNGNVKKVTSSVYEIYPSPDPGLTYRKLIERDGRPLTPEETAREDQKQEEKQAKTSVRLAAEGNQKRAAERAEKRLKEAETVETIFQVYWFHMIGRETLGGRPAILFTFEPRPEFEATTRIGKIFKKFAGRAWIDEEDRQLVRLQAELIDDLSFGFGILARLKKGARAQLQRRKVNGEIWLPSEARFLGQARLFLIKGLNIDSVSEYSDYKKFTTATDAAVRPEN